MRTARAELGCVEHVAGKATVNPQSRHRTQNAREGAKYLKERVCGGEAIGPGRDMTARDIKAVCCRQGFKNHREEIEMILRHMFVEARVFFPIP